MTRIEFYGNLNKYKVNEKKNEDSELMHYGILGQKWGQRRWQNPDGTFNAEGKERYFGSKKAQEVSDNDLKDTLFKVYNKKWNKIPNDEKQQLRNEISRIRKDFANGKSIEDIAKNSNFEEYQISDILGKEQKIGMAGIYDIAAGVISVKNAINNYDDVQALRKSYGDFMNSSDKEYTKDERTSIMNNKKKIAKMQEALELNDQTKYDKLLKKIKDKDADAVKKFLQDYNEKNNKMSKMPEDTQKKLEDSVEKLGSISKPKVPKKYLNEDGTLNDRGKQRAASNRKVSDVASSVFLALRNFNLFEMASLPVAGAVLALSGFGVPAVLGTAIAGAIMAPGVAIDHALYKKLEKRADAYYEMLQ